MAYNYCGQRAGRPHLATWAEAGITLATDLLAGSDDVRSRVAHLLGSGAAALPPALGQGRSAGEQRPAMRADAWYFTAELAVAAAAAGADLPIAAKRNTATWRAAAGIAEEAWTDAMGMHGSRRGL